MNRRSFVNLGLGSAVAAQTPAPSQRKPSTRPNILFLMADQLRADCLGCYGNRVIHTPNLDRIARDGVAFTALTLPSQVVHPPEPPCSQDCRPGITECSA